MHMKKCTNIINWQTLWLIRWEICQKNILSDSPIPSDNNLRHSLLDFPILFYQGMWWLLKSSRIFSVILYFLRYKKYRKYCSGYSLILKISKSKSLNMIINLFHPTSWKLLFNTFSCLPNQIVNIQKIKNKTVWTIIYFYLYLIQFKLATLGGI